MLVTHQAASLGVRPVVDQQHYEQQQHEQVVARFSDSPRGLLPCRFSLAERDDSRRGHDDDRAQPLSRLEPLPD